MARSGRPKAELVLTEAERDQLTRWSRRAKSAQALALRSRIVLACAGGVDNKTVAVRLGCAGVTVGKWRARFVEDRLDGLLDEPRPGRPPVIGVGQVEDVVVATVESTPANATHWSRAKMARRTGLSKSTIGRIWRTFELKPHRADARGAVGAPCLRQPCPPQVVGVVVAVQVHLQVVGDLGVDLGQELLELGCPVAPVQGGDHRSVGGVERREQAQTSSSRNPLTVEIQGVGSW